MNTVRVILLCIALLGQACAPGRSARSSSQAADPQQLQRTIMSFADRYIGATSEVYEEARLQAANPHARMMSQRLKIVAANEAISNAVEPNPTSGLTGMAVMATLTREVSEQAWVAETFSPELAATLVEALKAQESEIWGIAANHFTPGQLDELRQLADRWRSENPNDRIVVGTRLADILDEPATPGAASQFASSIINLVSLDPFRGLDPAVKEFAQSRVLAERIFFYARHLPTLLNWQSQALVYRVLEEPQMVKLLADTSVIAASTTRFSDSTAKFSDAGAAFADTVEKFRTDLPQQQSTLISQLDSLVATQRDAALKQATTEIAAQRDAAIQQLSTAVTSQQQALTENAQQLSDRAIDRVYKRAVTLVLISVGAVLLAAIAFRLGSSLIRKKSYSR